jgi:hypothetical protein
MRAIRRLVIAATTAASLGLAPGALASPGWVNPAATLLPSTSGTTLATPLVAANARGDTVAVWTNNAGNGPFMESERPAGGSFATASQPVLNPGSGDLNTNTATALTLGLDDAGTIYMFFVSGSGNNTTSQINVATKPIGGSAWTVTVIRAKGVVGGFASGTPAWGAVAPNGAAEIVWLEDNTNNFTTSVFDYSTKAAGSSTWSAPASTGVVGGATGLHTAVDSSGDIAAVFGFSGAANLKGATKSAGGGWTAASTITTSAGGASIATNPAVAMSPTGQATAIWTMSDSGGLNPVVQFSTKALSASSWPQAPHLGGANDLSSNGSSAGVPSMALSPDGTTTVAFSVGSSVIAQTRPAAGGSFSSATLPNTLTSPFGAAVVAGGDGSTTVLWSGTGGGSTPTLSGAYRAPGASTFAATPNAPGTSNSQVAAAANGVGDVSAVWQDQKTPGNYQYDASGLVTAPPKISGVSYPSTATVGSPFAYTATITPDQWTTATGNWSFGDGTTGPVSGSKTYSAPGSFNAVLIATDPFGNSATATVPVSVSGPGGGGGGGGAGGGGGSGGAGGGGGGGTVIHAPGKPQLHHKFNHKKHTATFRFSDQGATGFQCSLVKVKRHGKKKPKPKPHYASCRSPKTYKHLKHGSYEFFVRGANQAGKGKPATFKFKF